MSKAVEKKIADLIGADVAGAGYRRYRLWPNV
jgi:hypothetical protein